MTFGRDDYPRSWTGTDDPFGFALKECASFVDWRFINDFKLGPQHSAAGLDGYEWVGYLASKGYPTGVTPEVHDVLSLAPHQQGSGAAGHTAIVLGVPAPGKVDVEDYNWYGTRQYLRHTMSTVGCTFAHVQPGPTPPPPPLIEGTDMSNVRFIYWPEKAQQHVFQLNTAGELYAKYWPGPNNGWGNAKVGSNLNTAQGLDAQFSAGGQLHVVCQGNDGLVHQWYQSASGAGSTTWSEQILP